MASIQVTSFLLIFFLLACMVIVWFLQLKSSDEICVTEVVPMECSTLKGKQCERQFYVEDGKSYQCVYNLALNTCGRFDATGKQRICDRVAKRPQQSGKSLTGATCYKGMQMCGYGYTCNPSTRQCEKTCSTSSDCADGEVCGHAVGVQKTVEVSMCYRKCETDDDCYGNYECLLSSKQFTRNETRVDDDGAIQGLICIPPGFLSNV